jgi:UDP-N-acetylglucosamine:LPS N-acetylglucosamine transferase
VATPLLFLIADTGGGHRASANAVTREIEARWPGVYDVHIVDPFAQNSPRAIKRTADLYGPIIQNAHWLWGGIYYTTNSRAAIAALRGSILRPVRRGLERLITDLNPAAIVSFHPLLNHITARARERLHLSTPLITVITDLVDVHAAWACRTVDAVVVPSPGGMDRCRRAGVPAGRVYEFGLPVDPAFTAPAPTEEQRRELRRELGFDPDAFCVLLCGGADGSGGIAKRGKALAEAGLAIDLAIVCGRNHRAQEKLNGLTDKRGKSIPVSGFVDNMAQWVRAADLVITKAGPGTIAECLSCGTPMVLSWHLPGQERGNVEWVVDSGAGRYVPTVRGLIDTVAELSTPGSDALASMREAVTAAARPGATHDIADLITGFAQHRE